MKKSIMTGLALIFGVVSLVIPTAHAESTNVGLYQYMEDPIAKIFFTNSQGQLIDNPQIQFPMKTTRYQCQRPTADDPGPDLGNQYQKLHISVPDRVVNGWNVSIAPTNGTEAGWVGESGNTFAINDPTDGGCGRSSDRSGFGGLLTIDTSEMTASGECSTGCTSSADSPIKGNTHNFYQLQDISLYRSDMPHVGWDGTLDSVRLKQTIPAAVPADSYSLPMTLTLTEL